MNQCYMDSERFGSTAFGFLLMPGRLPFPKVHYEHYLY